MKFFRLLTVGLLLLTTKQMNSQAGAALNFDGFNDFVEVATATNLPLGNSPRTLEAWIKTTYVGGSTVIFNYGTIASNQRCGLIVEGGSGRLYFVGEFNDLQGTATSTVADGNWHHVAVVYTGGPTGTLSLYVDGVFNTSQVKNLNTTGTNLRIGQRAFPQTGERFNGSIDEVRIWNVARTQCEINAFKNCEIPSTATGLVANYHFNQGVAGAANPTVTTLTDVSGSANTGTVLNLALTGTTSNWVSPGGVVSDFTTSTTPSITLNGNFNLIANGTTTTTLLNNTDFGSATTQTFVISNTGSGPLHINAPYFTGPAASRYSILVPPAGMIASMSTSSFVVLFTPTTTGVQNAVVNINNNDCNKPIYNFAISASAPEGAALKHDGSNDYFITNNLAGQINGGSQGITVEVWFKANSHGIIMTELGQTAVNTGWHDSQIEILPSGEVRVRVWALNYVTIGYASFGTWNHAVMRYNYSTQRLDGFLNGNQSVGFTNGFRSAPGNLYYAFGIFDGTNMGSGQAFNGTIDEVRIWNVPRSNCQIQNYKNCEIPSGAPGLVANYHLNRGVGNGNNPGLNTVIDNTGNGNNATMFNFALSGTNSNWVTPGAVTSGASCSQIDPIDITQNVEHNICAGKSTTFTVAGPNNYNWYSSPTSPSVLHNGFTYVTPTLSAGTYTYYVSGIDLCNQATRIPYSVSVSVNPNVTVSGGLSAICPNTSVALTANGADSYSWSTGALLSNIVATPSVNTSYTVIGTIGNCSATAVKNVTVSPTIAITGNTLLCNGGGPASLFASGANTYTWSTGSNASFINVTPTVNTTYTVTGTSISPSCTNTRIITVTVSTTPTINIAGTFTICDGQSTTLTASGADSYTWSNTVTNPSSVYSPTTSTNVIGVQGMNLVGCTSFTTQTITVNPSPFLDIVAPSYVCIGTSGTIAAVSPNSITWNTGSTNNTIVVTPDVETTYTVVATHTVNSCTRTKTATIKIDPCTGLSNNVAVNSDLMVYPNPNNGEFTIELNNNSEKTIEITDISGRVLVSVKSAEQKNNFNISQLSNGIYFVRIQSENSVQVVRVIKQ